MFSTVIGIMVNHNILQWNCKGFRANYISCFRKISPMSLDIHLFATAVRVTLYKCITMCSLYTTQ